MKLQELIRIFHFKGRLYVYNYNADEDKITEYVNYSGIDELLFGNPELNKEVALYQSFLYDREVKYFSLEMYNDSLVLWICVQKGV